MVFIPTKINIGGIKINSAEHKSAVSIGENFLKGNNTFAKKNQGFGQQLGDLTLDFRPIHITFDDEIIDNPVVKNSH
ncbi:hypothetical protein QNH39_13330 [Neobacillus novalis]|uniref:Spore germination protein n=1 Tax=Neobacillus novalis TaxID=220687 RepID=A0AA95SJI6_9BACI|nr:hypothetical protein [Neobacillus novalis]WHY88751.1 hypothetical protein QNH39_13330 [Neobacillus novalis]